MSLASTNREQCARWNSNREHQWATGPAQTRGCTYEHQVAGGNAVFLAFIVRFRAQVGHAPLPVPGVEQAVAKHVTPADIHACGRPQTPYLAESVYRAWCAGQLVGVQGSLSNEQELPPGPHGLWAPACGGEGERRGRSERSPAVPVQRWGVVGPQDAARSGREAAAQEGVVMEPPKGRKDEALEW